MSWYKSRKFVKATVLIIGLAAAGMGAGWATIPAVQQGITAAACAVIECEE